MNSLGIVRFIRYGSFEKAKMLVPIFYYFLILAAIQQLTRVHNVLQLGPSNFEPILPIWWTSYLGYDTVVYVIVLGFLISSLIGALFYKWRWARIVAVVGILEYNAYLSSFQAPDHHADLWLWVAIFFAALPDVWRNKDVSDATRQKFLSLFWGAQAFTLLIYSMSGMWKTLAAVQQVIAGQASVFSFDAAAMHIATQFIRQSGDTTSIFGPFIIEYPLFAWLPLIAVLYVQLFAFWVAFKPNLHRAWGFMIACMHIGIYLTLYVEFLHHVFVLLVLLAESPFRSERANWKDRLYDLPIFGLLFRRIEKLLLHDRSRT